MPREYKKNVKNPIEIEFELEFIKAKLYAELKLKSKEIVRLLEEISPNTVSCDLVMNVIRHVRDLNDNEFESKILNLLYNKLNRDVLFTAFLKSSSLGAADIIKSLFEMAKDDFTFTELIAGLSIGILLEQTSVIEVIWNANQDKLSKGMMLMLFDFAGLSDSLKSRQKILELAHIDKIPDLKDLPSYLRIAKILKYAFETDLLESSMPGDDLNDMSKKLYAALATTGLVTEVLNDLTRSADEFFQLGENYISVNLVKAFSNFAGLRGSKKAQEKMNELAERITVLYVKNDDNVSEIVKLDSKSISTILASEAKAQNTKMITKILEKISSEKIDREVAFNVVKYATEYNDIKLRSKILELTYAKLHNDVLFSVFFMASLLGAADIIKTLFEMAKDKFTFTELIAGASIAISLGKDSVIETIWNTHKDKLSKGMMLILSNFADQAREHKSKQKILELADLDITPDFTGLTPAQRIAKIVKYAQIIDSIENFKTNHNSNYIDLQAKLDAAMHSTGLVAQIINDSTDFLEDFLKLSGDYISSDLVKALGDYAGLLDRKQIQEKINELAERISSKPLKSTTEKDTRSDTHDKVDNEHISKIQKSGGHELVNEDGADKRNTIESDAKPYKSTCDEDYIGGSLTASLGENCLLNGAQDILHL